MALPLDGNQIPDPAVTTHVKLLLTDPLAVGDAVIALRRYSLVTLAGNDLVLVHACSRASRSHVPADQTSQCSQAAAALGRPAWQELDDELLPGVVVFVLALLGAASKATFRMFNRYVDGWPRSPSTIALPTDPQS